MSWGDRYALRSVALLLCGVGMTGDGLAGERLTGSMRDQFLFALVAAEGARARRNAIDHQDWLLRGRDAMRPASELARIAPEDWPRTWRSGSGSRGRRRLAPGAVPERSRHPRADPGRAPTSRPGARRRDRPCIRADVPGCELAGDRQPAWVRPPGLIGEPPLPQLTLRRSRCGTWSAESDRVAVLAICPFSRHPQPQHGLTRTPHRV